MRNLSSLIPKPMFFFFLSLAKDMFIDIRERERNIMWERNIHQLPPIYSLTRGWTHDLGMCPDWEWYLQLFGVWDKAATNWAT